MRTNFTWEKHELNITEGDIYKMWDLKIPESKLFRVQIINFEDICIIKGDFGRWTFCRKFADVKNGKISDEYWLEKLEHHSAQIGMEWDEIETENELIDLIKSFEQNDEQTEALEFLTDLMNECHNEEGYNDYIKMFKPHFLDETLIPKYFKIKKQLQIIFDAMEEISARI